MDKEEFIDLAWRLDEILMQADHLRSQIGKCGGVCDGLDGVDDEGLCPQCCDVYAKVLAEEERLAGNKELDEVMKKLNQACEEDKTGVYQKILDQSRKGRIVH